MLPDRVVKQYQRALKEPQYTVSLISCKVGE